MAENTILNMILHKPLAYDDDDGDYVN